MLLCVRQILILVLVSFFSPFEHRFFLLTLTIAILALILLIRNYFVVHFHFFITESFEILKKIDLEFEFTISSLPTTFRCKPPYPISSLCLKLSSNTLFNY